MKKVLIVAYYFPPLAASGSLRPRGFCRYLEEYGWTPSVLTTVPSSTHPLVGVDEGLNAQLPLTIRVHRVPDRNPMPHLLAFRERMRNRKHSVIQSVETHPLLCNDSHSGRTKSGLQEHWAAIKNFFLDAFFAFPDLQCFWLRPAVRQLVRLPRDGQPDVVFATGSPWTSLLVGKALAERFGVPFLADFRDPWTRNPSKRILSQSLSCRAKVLERTVCETAARVITNTVELRDQLGADYPDLQKKFLTITNGFDENGDIPAERPLLAQKCLSPLSSGGQVLQLCHFGSIYGNRNPLPLLEAIKELLGENKDLASHIRVRFVGPWELETNYGETLARELEAYGILQREAPIPHDICVQQMAVTPILLVLQPSFPLQVPAKIYDYIATGRPLLVLGGEGATANLVERYKLGLCCRNESVMIKKLLQNLMINRVRIEAPPSSVRSQFSYRTLTKELANVLENVYVENQKSL